LTPRHPDVTLTFPMRRRIALMLALVVCASTPATELLAQEGGGRRE
jgi:hypothetical protein